MPKRQAPNLIKRLGLAMSVITKGGMAEVAEHFRRARSQNAKGGPSSPYQQIVAVFRCIEFLGSAVQSMPFYVSTNDDRIIESGPIAQLLDRPNPKMSIGDFWQQTLGWLLLTGRCHWVFTQRVGNRPTEIVPVGAAQMQPITSGAGNSGELTGWKYRPAGYRWDQAVSLELDEVWTMQIQSFNPDRPYEGLAIVDVVRKGVNQVYKSDIANEASLDNGVEPGGALKTPNNLSSDQKKDLREFIEEHHAGAGNRRRLMLLEGGLEFQAMQSVFKDMEFSTLKKFSRADVCVGFGLDPSAVGFPPEGGRFEYAKAAEDKAWISRVLPLATWLAGQFDRGVLSHYENDRSLTFGRSVRDAVKRNAMQAKFSVRRAHQSTRRPLFAWFDASVVEAVKELTASRVETATKMVRDLKATPEEAGDLFDLGLAGNEAQKLVWIGVGEMPFGEPLPGDDDPDNAPPPEDEDDDERTCPGCHLPYIGQEEYCGNCRNGLTPGVNLPKHLKVQRKLTDAQLRQIWKAWRSSWAGLERAMNGKVGKHFLRLRGQVLANLGKLQLSVADNKSRYVEMAIEDVDVYPFARDHMHPHGIKQLGRVRMTIQQRDLIGEILFSLVKANGALRVAVGPIIRNAVRLGGEQAMNEHAQAAGQDEATPFNIKDDQVAATIRQREIKVTDINRTLRRRLSSQIAQGVDKQETVTQIAERIRKEFNFASARSQTIARTEVGSAVEEARQHGRDQAGTPLKSWLWSAKETGRREHAVTERVTMSEPVANDELFTIAGTSLTCKHPRATGDPAHDINCGCTTLARFPGDSVKAVLQRYTARGYLTDQKMLKHKTKAGDTK